MKNFKEHKFFGEYELRAKKALDKEREQIEFSREILNKIEEFIRGQERLSVELDELQKIYDKKFQRIPAFDKEWKEEEKIRQKIEDKQKAIDFLQEEIDNLFGKIPENDEDIEKKLEKISRELAEKYRMHQ